MKETLEQQVGYDMRERYELDLEQARAHHQEMKVQVAERLLTEHRILCIDTEQTGLMRNPAWETLHPEQRQLYVEAHMGGVEQQLYAPIFRYMFGYAVDDDRFESWEPGHEERPSVDVEDVDAVLVTGSASMVTAMKESPDSPDAQWMKRVGDYMKLLKEKNIPTLAVCFGHQIYALHEAGDVDWMQDDEGNRVREFGPSQLFLTDEAKNDPLLQGIDKSFWVQSSHSQEVRTKPAGSLVLAENPVSGQQLLRYIEGVQWTMQNHPELTSIIMDIALSLRARAIEDEMRNAPEFFKRQGYSTLEELRELIVTQDTGQVRTTLFSNFLQVVADQIRAKK